MQASMKKFFYFFFVVFFIVSCYKSKVKTTVLDHEHLFSIEYGNFEDEINLSHIDPMTYSAINLCLNNGIFYISNSVNKKVLKTSFYGDLLALYYNNETNPHPSFLPKAETTTNTDESTIGDFHSDMQTNSSTHLAGTRTAVEYPFNNCTMLTVSDIEHLYLVDTVPNDRVQFDNEENIALMNVILHFDEKGNFVDYIGQEGLGGTPFPNIVSLSNNSENDIIVVCRTISFVKVFWFSSDGVLLSRIFMDISNLPSEYDSTTQFYANIDSVFPSYERNEIFLKIDYYVEHYDQETGANIGVNYDKSSIYRVVLSRGEFEYMQDIFSYKQVDDKDAIVAEKVYMLKKVCKNDWAFLMAQVDNNYSILLLNLQTGKTKSFFIDVSDFSPLYSTFYVTNDCMLSGIFAGEEKATISVWHIENSLGR